MFLRKVVRTSSSGSFHKLKYNWNFAKVYCFFSIIGASEKLVQSFSSQCSLSKELWIVKIRSVFREKIFFSVTTCLGEFNYADNWNFAKVYWSSITGASEKIAQPFSTKFKLCKLTLNFWNQFNICWVTIFSFAYMFTRELNYADNWNFATINCSFFYYRCIGNTGSVFVFTIKYFKEFWILEIR